MSTGTDSQYQELFEKLEQLVVADPVEAVRVAQKAIPVIDQESTVANQLRFRRMLAMAYAHTSRFDNALDVCDEATSLAYASSEPVELARIRLASMQPLAHLGKIDAAIQVGETALAVLESEGNNPLAGRAALNIGAILAMTGRHQDALSSFDRALKYLANEPILAGQIQTNRGTSLAALDRFDDAQVAFERAGELMGEDLPWAAAIVEGNLADLASRQGAIARSVKHFEATRRYLEQDEALGDLGRLEAEEATVLVMSGFGSIAHDAFARAIPLLTEHGTPGDLAMARIGYGRALVESGHLTEAEGILESVGNALDPKEFPELRLQYLSLATQLALVQERLDDAASLITEGRVGVSDRPVQRVGWAMFEARLAQLSGDDLQAQSLLVDTLKDAQAIGVTPLIATINEDLAQIARRLGQHDMADGHARKAIAGYESIRGTIHADQLRQMWHHNKIDVFGRFASRLIGRDSIDAQREAFDIVERIRGRALLDAMGAKSRDIDRSDRIPPDEQPLVNELTDHRRWLNWTYSSVAKGQVLSNEQLSELKQRERATARLEDRLAVLRPGGDFNQPVSIDEVQCRLSPGHAVLSYLVIEDRLTLQLIRDDDVRGFDNLAMVDEIADLVSAMQFQVGRALVSSSVSASPRRQTRLRRDMDAVLERLYDALIAPAKHMLNGIDHVVIIPSGDLHSVPFAALRFEGRYLCDHATIATAPGVSVLAGMTSSSAVPTFAPQRGLIVGASDDAAPGLGIEAQTLATYTPESILLLDEQATRQAVLAAMPTSDWIHLACHGRFDPALPAASGLKLGDGWITLDDLRRIRLEKPLVVLSGCETGRARVDRGDDLIGLIASLISSGASGLVMSLWKTHDDAGLLLMTELYKALDSGESLATAMQISQNAVRQTFEHPAMWAPLFGLGMVGKENLI